MFEVENHQSQGHKINTFLLSMCNIMALKQERNDKWSSNLVFWLSI